VLTKKFTYIVDISDLNIAWQKLEKRTRGAIKSCQESVYKTDDIYNFDYLHQLTRPDRKITSQFIYDTYKDLWPNCQIYSTRNASALISWDKDRAYYLLAARDKKKTASKNAPSKILWTAFEDLNKMGIKEIDLCGANKENIAFFKRGFGGIKVKQEIPCLIY